MLHVRVCTHTITAVAILQVALGITVEERAAIRIWFSLHVLPDCRRRPLSPYFPASFWPVAEQLVQQDLTASPQQDWQSLPQQDLQSSSQHDLQSSPQQAAPGLQQAAPGTQQEAPGLQQAAPGTQQAGS